MMPFSRTTSETVYCRIKLLFLFLSLILALPALPKSCADSRPDMPFTVTHASPLPALSARFLSRQGWTGGDGAYSVPLNSKRTLWLFGDSFIGTIKDGRRVHPRMINNACAWQTLDNNLLLQFFWKHDGGLPSALLAPERKGTYYWPSDGSLVGGRLYLFCKRIKDDTQAQGLLKFQWTGDDIIQVVNPADEPRSWRFHSFPLPGGELDIHLGTACLLHDGYLYIYSSQEAKTSAGHRHFLVLARLKDTCLSALDLSSCEYFCRKSNEAGQTMEDKTGWSREPLNPVVLFEDAAPEMTVSSVRGLKGFFAVYTPFGLSDRICLRWAEHPEGPWSEPLDIYRCPEATDRKLLCYGAKAHQELSSADRQLIITYCLNPGELAAHINRPFTYFPHAINVSLGFKPGAPAPVKP